MWSHVHLVSWLLQLSLSYVCVVMFMLARQNLSNCNCLVDVVLYSGRGGMTRSRDPCKNAINA